MIICRTIGSISSLDQAVQGIEKVAMLSADVVMNVKNDATVEIKTNNYTDSVQINAGIDLLLLYQQDLLSMRTLSREIFIKADVRRI